MNWQKIFGYVGLAVMLGGKVVAEAGSPDHLQTAQDALTAVTQYAQTVTTDPQKQQEEVQAAQLASQVLPEVFALIHKK